MVLTGKCKEDFDKWFLLKYLGYNGTEYENDGQCDINVFTNAHGPSMQYGVYVDFFDSVGIIIDIQPLLDYDTEKYTKVYSWLFSVNQLNVSIQDNEENEYNRSVYEKSTRQEAREQAISKANEIYNSKNK